MPLEVSAAEGALGKGMNFRVTPVARKGAGLPMSSTALTCRIAKLAELSTRMGEACPLCGTASARTLAAERTAHFIATVFPRGDVRSPNAS